LQAAVLEHITAVVVVVDLGRQVLTRCLQTRPTQSPLGVVVLDLLVEM
jgi:hypothetical protein